MDKLVANLLKIKQLLKKSANSDINKEQVSFLENGQWTLNKSKNSNKYWDKLSGGDPEIKASMRRPTQHIQLLYEHEMLPWQIEQKQHVFPEQKQKDSQIKTRKLKSGESSRNYRNIKTTQTTGTSVLNPEFKGSASQGTHLLAKDPDRYSKFVDLKNPTIEHPNIDQIRSKAGIDPSLVRDQGENMLENFGATSDFEKKPKTQMLQ